MTKSEYAKVSLYESDVEARDESNQSVAPHPSTWSQLAQTVFLVLGTFVAGILLGHLLPAYTHATNDLPTQAPAAHAVSYRFMKTPQGTKLLENLKLELASAKDPVSTLHCSSH